MPFSALILFAIGLFVIETWILGSDFGSTVLGSQFFQEVSIKGLEFGAFAYLGVYKLVKMSLWFISVELAGVLIELIFTFAIEYWFEGNIRCRGYFLDFFLSAAK